MRMLVGGAIRRFCPFRSLQSAFSKETNEINVGEVQDIKFMYIMLNNDVSLALRYARGQAAKIGWN